VQARAGLSTDMRNLSVRKSSGMTGLCRHLLCIISPRSAQLFDSVAVSATGASPNCYSRPGPAQRALSMQSRIGDCLKAGRIRGLMPIHREKEECSRKRGRIATTRGLLALMPDDDHDPRRSEVRILSGARIPNKTGHSAGLPPLAATSRSRTVSRLPDAYFIASTSTWPTTEPGVSAAESCVGGHDVLTMISTAW
jgi:hypothetical protein